jgi:diguanylate cyclase (GGDEF)-like protein
MLAFRSETPMGLPVGLIDAQLHAVSKMAQALEQDRPIEQSFDLCLRTLFEIGGWHGGCATLVSSVKKQQEASPVIIRHPIGIVDRPENLSAPSLVRKYAMPGIGEIILDLYGDPGTPDARLELLIDLVCAILRRAVQRWHALWEREHVAADREHRWVLLKKSEDILREQYARLYTAINNMSQGLAMYDGDGKLIICNDLYATMYGLRAGDVRAGTSVRQIARRRQEKGYDVVDNVQDGAFDTNGALALRNESRVSCLPDGRRIAISIQPLWNGGWVTTHEDTTERQRFEDRISHLALHDALTDLANRTLFRERLDQALKQCRRGGDSVAIHWIDLDRFKLVNDTLGHICGDLLLKSVARRLRECIRETDLVARLGGDEFAVLQIPAKTQLDADTLARRLRLAIAEPHDVDGRSISIDASIGICMASSEIEAEQLLRDADTALYRAKAEGRCTHRFFRPEMDAAVQVRRKLEADLRRALDENEFDLHYQPIVDLRTGAIAGCEALLRWTHRERGPLSPSEFIPVAEEGGLMVRLGNWVLERACRDAAAWPANMTIAVNVSPSHVMSQQLNSGVLKALGVSRLPAERLEIEITEAGLMQNTLAAQQVLGELSAFGVKFSLDDFGTGYSSLSYLQRFPFSKIKIDRSFIAGLPAHKPSHAIVKAITHLAQGLSVVTTAEGVETAAQLRAVRALGCTQMQGFLFSAPVSNADLIELVKSPKRFNVAA